MKSLPERRNRDDPRERRIAKLNEQELAAGVSEAGSWHNDYKDSAFICKSNSTIQFEDLFLHYILY